MTDHLLTKLRRLGSPDFWRDGNRSWYGSLLASTAVHLGLLALVGYLWIATAGQPGVPRVETRWMPAEPLTELTPVELAEPLASAEPEAAGGPHAATLMLDARPRTSAEVVPVLTSPPAPAHFLATGLPAELGEEVGAAPSGGGGQGDGSGEGDGDGTGGGFFGAEIQGKRIVYVVDSSLSMNHPHDSEYKTRFRRLKAELVKSIAGMDPNMAFFVIFFSDQTHPMPASALQPATPFAQKYYLEWVAKFRCDGKTDPRDALKMAMRLRPDVIYFLTDGEFTRRIEHDVLALPPTGTVIHTFCMGDPSGEKVLKALAGIHGGEYHFVP